LPARYTPAVFYISAFPSALPAHKKVFDVVYIKNVPVFNEQYTICN
jgi:hypothetical protein